MDFLSSLAPHLPSLSLVALVDAASLAVYVVVGVGIGVVGAVGVVMGLWMWHKETGAFVHVRLGAQHSTPALSRNTTDGGDGGGRGTQRRRHRSRRGIGSYEEEDENAEDEEIVSPLVVAAGQTTHAANLSQVRSRSSEIFQFLSISFSGILSIKNSFSVNLFSFNILLWQDFPSSQETFLRCNLT